MEGDIPQQSDVKPPSQYMSSITHSSRAPGGPSKSAALIGQHGAGPSPRRQRLMESRLNAARQRQGTFKGDEAEPLKPPFANTARWATAEEEDEPSAPVISFYDLIKWGSIIFLTGFLVSMILGKWFAPPVELLEAAEDAAPSLLGNL